MERNRLRNSWLLVFAFAILIASMGGQVSRAQAAGCASVDKWSQWTQGRLRGFNIWAEHANQSWETTGPLQFPYTQADFEAIAALGANYVQISHPGLFRMRPPYKVDTEAQANLDQLLKMIGKSGLKAVIAFRTGPGRNEYAFRYQGSYDPKSAERIYEPLWNSTRAQSAFVAMMRYTASRYKNSCVVIGYDPLVEPNFISTVADQTGIYLAPDLFYAKYGGSINDWNRLTPRITAAIRKVDKNTPILLEPEGYGAVEFLPYLKVTGDPRTVYTVHNYGPQESYTTQPKGGTVTYPGLMDLAGDESMTLVDRNWQSTLLQPLRDFKIKHNVPVAVTEMGAVRFAPGVIAFLNDQFDLLAEIGAGYALWEWRARGDLYYDFDFLMGTDPNNEVPDPSNPLLALVEKHFTKKK